MHKKIAQPSPQKFNGPSLIAWGFPSSFPNEGEPTTACDKHWEEKKMREGF